jgi:hypothetical protein
MVQQQYDSLIEVALSLPEHVGVGQKQAACFWARQLMRPFQLIELAALCC